jgi:predicted PurR-regulated permease PerM
MTEHTPDMQKTDETKVWLAYWGIFLVLFRVLRLFLDGLAGSLFAGALAAFATSVILERLPRAPNGRRLPVWVSVLLLVLGVGTLVLTIWWTFNLDA